jgi:hypothetical protein
MERQINHSGEEGSEEFAKGCDLVLQSAGGKSLHWRLVSVSGSAYADFVTSHNLKVTGIVAVKYPKHVAFYLADTYSDTLSLDWLVGYTQLLDAISLIIGDTTYDYLIDSAMNVTVRNKKEQGDYIVDVELVDRGAEGRFICAVRVEIDMHDATVTIERKSAYLNGQCIY